MKTAKKLIKYIVVVIAVFLSINAIACKKEPKKLDSPNNLQYSLNLTNNNDTQIILSWDKVKDADLYYIDIDGKEISTINNTYNISKYLDVNTEVPVEVYATGDEKKFTKSDSAKITVVAKRITQNLKYAPIDGGYEVYRESSIFADELILPDTYQGVPVIEIKDYGFGIWKEDFAVRLTAAYNSIRFPNKLKVIGASAFLGAQLKSVDIPNTVIEIKDSAFYMCYKLQEVDLANVISIGYGAFSQCDLRELHIPKTVTELGGHGFEFNPQLKTVDIEDGIKLTNCGSMMFSGTALTEIPRNIPVISESMFSSCLGLVNVEIPSCVTEIWAGAFSGSTNIQNIYVPSSVTKLSGAAFDGIKYLETGYGGEIFGLNSTVNVFFAEDAFFEIKNGGIISKDGKQFVKYVKTEGEESLTVPDGVETICDYAFAYVNTLQELTIPNSVKNIDNYAFTRCDIEKINMSDGDLTIGKRAFEYCKMRVPIKLPNGLTKISDYLMGYSYFTHIEIPDSVTEIGAVPFTVFALESIILPKTIKSFDPTWKGYGLFGLVMATEEPILTKICFKGTVEEWQSLIDQGIIVEKMFTRVWINNRAEKLFDKMPIYFYSETEPTDTEHNYWYYGQDGLPAYW